MFKEMKVLLCLAALLHVVTSATDCSEVYDSWKKSMVTPLSAVYTIYPKGPGQASVEAYCQFIDKGTSNQVGGWTVILRRMDGSQNFYRPWAHYKEGFGNKHGEYWLGLENIHQLTRKRKYELRVDMEDFTGGKGYALYTHFSVDSEVDGYRLDVRGFAGGTAGDSLTYHNGMKFSTYDKDQDTSTDSCAVMHHGGFWFKDCFYSSPTGDYFWGKTDGKKYSGMKWYYWKNDWTSLKSITLKIRHVV